MKKVIESKRIIMSLSVGFIIIIALLCSVMALGGADLLSAEAETATVSQSDEQPVFLAGATGELGVSAAGDPVTIKVTRRIDGETTFIPYNDDTKSLLDKLENSSTTVDITPFEEYEGTVTAGSSVTFSYDCVHERYVISTEHLMLYYVKSDGSTVEIAPTYRYKGNRKFSMFTVPSDESIEEIVINCPYITVVEEAHKVSVRRDKNNLRLDMNVHDSATLEVDAFYNSPTGLDAYKKAVVSANNDSTAESAFYVDGAFYAQGGLKFTMTGNDYSERNAFTLSDATIYTADKSGNYTVERPDLISYDDSTGKYVIDMPHEDILIDVKSKNNMHKVRLEVSNSDHSLTSVSLITTTSISLYETANGYYTEDLICITSKIHQLTPSGGKVVETLYHNRYNSSTYPNQRIGVLFKTPSTNSNKDIYQIENVKVYKMNEDGSRGDEVVYANEADKPQYGMHGVNGTSNEKYILVTPVDSDIIISCEFRMVLPPKSLYLYEKTHANGDMWFNRFVGYSYKEGTDEVQASSPSIDFESGRSYYTRNVPYKIGGFVQGEPIYYNLFSYYDYKRIPSVNWAKIKSWNVYEADANGYPVGEPIQDTLGLTFPDEPMMSSSNFSYFSNALFNMPDIDLVFCVEYDETTSPMRIEQYVVDEDGNQTAAGEDFYIDFEGTKGDASSNFSSRGDSFTAISTEASPYYDFWVTKGAKELKFTINAKEGYDISSIKLYSTTSVDNGAYLSTTRSEAINSYLKRDDDGVWTFSTSNMYRSAYRMVVTYEKSTKVTITQKHSDDSIVIEGSTNIANVSVQNADSIGSPPFYNCPTNESASWVANTFYNAVTYTLKSSERSDTFSMVYGARMKITVTIQDSSRIIDEFNVYKLQDGEKVNLEYTKTSSSYSQAVYTLNEPTASQEEVFVEVSYKVASKLTAAILVKDTRSVYMVPNTLGVTAKITGTGASTDKAFIPLGGGEPVDSFTVGADEAEYTTVGNTQLTIEVDTDTIPDGYVIANVDVVGMTSAGGPNSSSSNALKPVVNGQGSSNESRDFSRCEFTMSGSNVYIRIILARTAKVTVTLRSRGDSNADIFVENTLDPAYITLSYTNNNYGTYLYPVIVENQYNVGAYTITKNPGTRTVDVLEQTYLSASYAVPKGYFVASVSSTKKDLTSSESTVENAELKINSYSFTNGNSNSTGHDLLEGSFRLVHIIEYGYHYNITINVEKYTEVAINSYHSTDEGTFVGNYEVSDSKANLYGIRTDSSAEKRVEYYSEIPFIRQDHVGSGNTGVLNTTKWDDDEPAYVLRDTDLTIKALPVAGEAVAFIKVYFASDPDTLIEHEYQGLDEDGWATYTIGEKTKMGDRLIVDVYFSGELSGTLHIYNKSADDTPLNENSYSRMSIENGGYDKPAQVMDTLEMVNLVETFAAEQHYRIMTGSTAYVYANAKNGWILESCKVKRHNDDPFVSYPNGCTFSGDDLTSDKEITVENTFRPAANWAFGCYNDSQGDWSKGQGGIITITATNEAMGSDSVIYWRGEYNSSISSNADRTGRIPKGSNITLKIEQYDGYTFDHLIIKKDGEVISTVYPVDMTVDATGKNPVYTYAVPFKTEQLMGDGYEFNAYYTAKYLRIAQECISDDCHYTYGGVSAISYPNTDDIIDTSINEITRGNDGLIAFCYGAKPRLRITTGYHHRIVKILVGDSASTLVELPGFSALDWEEEYILEWFESNPMTSDKYMKILYDYLPSEPVIKPEPPVVPPVNKLLTVNVYEADETGYKLTTDYQVTISVPEAKDGSISIYDNGTFVPIVGNEFTMPEGASTAHYSIPQDLRVYTDVSVKDKFRLEKATLVNTSEGTTTDLGSSLNSDNVASMNYFQLTSGNYTLNLYFSRPVLELGTNNSITVFKGAVKVNDQTAIAENEYMKAIRFDSGSTLSLHIEPQEGYKFTYILAGDTRDNMNAVTEDKIIRNEDGSAVVSFENQKKDLHVQIQFDRVNQISYSTLTVAHYMPTISGSYNLSSEGCVNVLAQHEFVPDPILYEDESVNTFDLTTQGSINAEVYRESSLKFTVTPPENYIVKKFEATGVDENGEDSDMAFTVENNVYSLTDAVANNKNIIIKVYYTDGYNIYYNGNGFTGGRLPEDTKIYYEGDSATILDSGSMVRENYEFKGWSLVGGDENTVDFAPEATITFESADINLFAVWEANAKYSVTYNGNGNTGGSAPVDALSPYFAGSMAEVLGRGDLEKTNYIFIGWNTDANANTAEYEQGDTIEISDDITLYAIWEELPQYTVTYKDSLDSDASVSENLYVNSKVNVKSVEEVGFAHSEYDFAGWSVSDESYSTEIGTEITVLSDVTYTAQWTPKNYDVIYLAQDGTEIATQKHPFNSSVTVGRDVTAPTITGKTFSGWELVEGGVTVADGKFTMPAKTVKFKAAYENIKYTVTYVVAGTIPAGYTKPADAQYNYGDTVTIADAPTGYDTARYNFSGWKSSNVDITSGSFTMPDIESRVVTITGTFTENEKVNLIYNANGGTPESAVPATESAYTTLNTTVKNPDESFGKIGHKFIGWNTNADGSGSRYEKGDSLNLTSDLTLYAEWEKAQFTVEYYPETGDTPIASQQYTYQSNVTVGENVTAPKVSGKVFFEWKMIEGGVTVSDGQFTMPANVVKFRATYTAIEYSVKYVLAGAVPDGITAPTDTASYHYEDNVTLKAVPSGYDTARYSFSGWSATDVVISDGSFTMPDVASRVVTITGTFTENEKVNLVYNANGGTPEDSVPAAQSAYKSLSTIVKAADSSFGKLGYEFTGWNTKANGTGDSYAVGATIEITVDTTLYAQWKKASFNVEYYGEGGTDLIQCKSYEYEANVTVGENIVAPSVIGKVFTGWQLIDNTQTDSEGTAIGERTQLKMPATTVKYKATYENIKYTVTYVVAGTTPDGYTKPADAQYNYGDTVTIAAAPLGYDTARYNFSGWSSSDVDITSGSFTMPDIASRVVTITGTFTENGKVNLVYNANGGTPENAVPAAESAYTSLSTTVKSPEAAFGKTGYEFTGWNTKADGSGDAYVIGATINITADTTLYAQWAIKNYVVEYYEENGSSLIASQNYTYRSTVTVGLDATAPTIDGKIFSHWALIDSNQTDADGTAIGTRQQFTMPNAVVQFRAVYTALEYKVTYVVSGNVPDGYTAPQDNNSYHYNDTVNVLSAPSADGYTFKGWTLNGVDYASNTEKSSFAITSDVTLVGVWSKNTPIDPSTAIITYISGVDTSDENDPLAKKYTCEVQLGEDYTVLPNTWYTREGYVFKNWVVVNNEITGLSLIDSFLALFTGVPNIGDKLNGGDVVYDLSDSFTLKAEWEASEYHITYDGNQNTGGSAPVDSKAYTYGENATVLSEGNLVKDGFTFVGWNTSPYGTGTSYKAGDSIAMNKDVTLYAVWHTDYDPDALYVTYDKNGADSGTAPVDKTKYKSGNSVTVKDKGNLTRSNCTFKEWNTKPDGKGTAYKPGDVFTMPDSNVTLYAIWVDGSGDIPDGSSPGTGESIMGAAIAMFAMLSAIAAVACVIMRERKRRRTA